MPRRSGLFLLLDACVVIDFHQADSALFRLVGRHVGRVHVPLPVLTEAGEPDRRSAARLGMRVITPTIDELVDAVRPRAGLSSQDRLCLEIARARGWTCVTNDARLRGACRSSRVPVVWSLELIACVVAAGGLSARRAESLAATMHAQNPRGVSAGVLSRFRTRLRGAR